jgi:hypothetical protein
MAAVAGAYVRGNYLVGRAWWEWPGPQSLGIRNPLTCYITNNEFLSIPYYFDSLSGYHNLDFQTYPGNNYTDYYLYPTTGDTSFVIPNKYESGRAHIAIYNWGKSDTVDVDLSKTLAVGEMYRIRNAMNYYDDLPLEGTYQGGRLRLPMNAQRWTMAKPRAGTIAQTTYPTFGAFILERLDPGSEPKKTGLLQDGTASPNGFRLGQNYPNPFNPSTKISVSLSRSATVCLEVYSVLGSLVTSLWNGELQAGEHVFNWEASDKPSGVYFYRITSAGFREAKKMLLTH